VVKGGRCEDLTTLPPSRADCFEIWEPQPPGILRVCPGLYRDCFSFYNEILLFELHVPVFVSRNKNKFTGYVGMFNDYIVVILTF